MLKIVSLIKHSVYSGYTYRAVSVKVLGDHKVHSAVLSCPGIDLTARTGQKIFLSLPAISNLSTAATDELDTSVSVVLVDASCLG